ncbi:MAG TPA: histidine kinase [Granulicella sp.]
MGPRSESGNNAALDVFRKVEFWLPFLVALHVLILLHATQWYTFAALSGDASHPFRYLKWAAELWYTRAALAPFAIYLAVRFRFDLTRWFRYVLFYSIATLVFALLASMLQAAAVGRLGTDKFFSTRASRAEDKIRNYDQLSTLKRAIAQGWPHLTYNMFTCWMLIGLVQGIYYYRDAREKELQSSQLQAQVATMRLDMLRLQLKPHFLFNTLHAISTLIDEDPAAAAEMLFRLSDLLRAVLENHQMQEISLREELKLVESHLAIERVRFGNRLNTEISVQPEFLDCAVPQFILQPLVENAIHHGIGKNAGTDKIEISASQDSDLLYLQVFNRNGHLIQSPADCLRSGIGLSNTKLRLETLYKEHGQIELHDHAPSGVKVSVSFPRKNISSSMLVAQELYTR